MLRSFTLAGGGRILLRLATRFNWRVAATILGIAVCAMYSSGAMVLMDGLQEGSVSVLSRIETGPFFVYRGTTTNLEAFSLPTGAEGDLPLGMLEETILQVENSTLKVSVFFLSAPRVFTLEGPKSREALLSSSLATNLGIDRGTPLSLGTPGGGLEFTFSGYLPAELPLPERWILISEADLRDLFPDTAGTYNFMLTEEREDAVRIGSQGFTAMSLSSAGDFFLIGLDEARRIVLSIVVASSIAIAALTFSLLSLEVRYRQGEMQTLRALGMDSRGFMKLYGLQMAFIVTVGSLMGLAMGIVVANGLVSFSPFFGLSTIIRPQVTAIGILLPLLSSLAAGLAGGVTTVLLTMRRFSHET